MVIRQFNSQFFPWRFPIEHSSRIPHIANIGHISINKDTQHTSAGIAIIDTGGLELVLC
jgi:hypothetical protein